MPQEKIVQFSLSIDPKKEEELQRREAELKRQEEEIARQKAELQAARYIAAFSENLKRLPPELTFGDFVLLINEQEQTIREYALALPLNELCRSVAGGGEDLSRQLRELQASYSQLQRERDLLFDEVAQLRTRPANQNEAPKNDTEAEGRGRRSKAEIEAQSGLFRPQILAYLENKPAQTMSEIAKALSVEPEDIRRFINELCDENKILKTGEKRATRYSIVTNQAVGGGE